MGLGLVLVRPCAGAAALTFGLATACAATSETLADAIALAYQSSPSLQSQRAQVRALDEAYVTQVGGWRPQLGLQVTSGYTDQQYNTTAKDTFSNTGGAQLGFSQPVITGGRISTAVKAAGFDVLAAREQLRAVEATVLQSVVQAYADVLRDQATLGVREAELEVLQSQLDDAKARRRAGEVTQTDVLQSLVQLQIARAQLSTAQGQLQVSRANYAAAVGQNPGQLAAFEPMPGLPTTVDEAFDVAQAQNPTLSQARTTENASRWRIAAARAANRPQVTVQGSYAYAGTVAPVFQGNTYLHTFTVQAVVTQPLFTGGQNSSAIRRAIDVNDNDRIQIEAQRRTVVQTVSQTWNEIVALKQSLVSQDQEVATAREYFADTEQEYRVGARSTLDILTAEQTLRAAEVGAIQARHDVVVAQASLLGVMGRLSTAALLAGAPQYDPSINLRRAVRAQATPWDGVIARLDTLSAPRPLAAAPLIAPGLADPPPRQRPPTGDLPLDAAPSLVVPARPAPGTVSPSTSAIYGRGADVGVGAVVVGEADPSAAPPAAHTLASPYLASRGDAAPVSRDPS